MRRIFKKLFLSIIAVFMAGSAVSFAFNLDSIKASFFQGDFGTVISKAELLLKSSSPQQAAELNYLLGMAYLKERKNQSAINYLEKAAKSARGSLREEANLGLADAYLERDEFSNARDICRYVLGSNSRTKFKSALYYRLSRAESGLGNKQTSREYLEKIKKEFPLAPEIKNAELSCPLGASGSPYSVQVGYFSNRNNAVKFRNKLVSEGYPAYIEEENAACRVKVGRFKDRQEAFRMEKRLSRAGYPTKVCP